MKKKSISPLVAEILMIAVAVMAGMIIMKWIGYYSSSSHEKTNERYNDVIYCSKVIPQLQYVILTKNTNKINMMITNKGSVNFPINKIEVYTSKGKCVISQPTSIKPGESKILSYDCNTQINISSCKEFRSLAVISDCIDKSIYVTKPLTESKNACKYENTI